MGHIYRLTLAYRGTAYAGWQRQPNAVTVQERVEQALAALLDTSAAVVGAGRTDAGVHARAQVAHLELARPFPETGLVHGANHRLPDDIRVLAAARMPPGFHARKHALAKEYRYRLIRTRILTPLDALFAVAVTPNLDLERLRQATAALVGEHDFTAFTLTGGAHRSPVRRIDRAAWHEQDNTLELHIEGNGFLRGMVRSLVGTLIEVARGRRNPADIPHLLTGRPRAEAGPTAPPQGLVLEVVHYGPEWEPDVSSLW
ncbi:MAG: tRNA pseudouridine(38-40) synthase TruA [Thermoanaerobaculia bacterium]